MQILLCGDTDKRPVVYTLIKLLEYLGDVCLVSENNHYRRLVEDYQEIGTLNKTFYCVTNQTVDDVFEDLSIDESHFDYVLYDNMMPATCDLIIYVKGFKDTEHEKDLLEAYDDVPVVEFKFGPSFKDLKFNDRMMENVETIESYRKIVEVDKRLTKVIASKLATYVKLTPQQIQKVVARKK